MPDGLTPDQIENLAQSIAHHAAGDTYGTGHLDDFGGQYERGACRSH